MRFLAVLLCLTLLTGCSFVENFVILNHSEEDISIHFSYSNSSTGFNIFDSSPDVYSLQDEVLNWSDRKEVDVKKDSSSYQLFLPANCGMVIGRLNNEHFESVNQEFINGRKFNFEQLDLTIKNKTTTIYKSTFSDYFVRKNGYIQFSVH
ncbi:MAG: hypothetical protein ABJG68_04450 [Crocinitomicaceae bacterium]